MPVIERIQVRERRWAARVDGRGSVGKEAETGAEEELTEVGYPWVRVRRAVTAFVLLDQVMVGLGVIKDPVRRGLQVVERCLQSLMRHPAPG